MNALVRARRVEVAAILAEHRDQVSLAEHENMVEAFPAYAAEKALAPGVRPRARTGVLRTLAPMPRAARSNSGPYLSSRSRMMNRGPIPNGVALRICRATQAELGSRVTAMYTTRRDPSSMMKNAKIGRNHRS